MLHKVISGVVLLTALVSLSGCNTFEGAGKDVQGAGEALADTAHESKDAINHRK